MPTITVKDASNVTQTINTLPNAGQDVSANSLPVVLASNQTAVPISGSLSIAGGSNAIGSITNTSFALATGSNAIGSITNSSFALATGSNAIGSITNTSFALATGSNAIGSITGIAAGQNLIGNVGGKTVTVTVTPGVTTGSSYGTNYVVGGLLTFTGAFSSTGTGILQAITVSCKRVESMGWTLFIFASNPNSSTWTDGSVSNINAADVNKAFGPFTPTASSALGTCTTATVSGIGLPLQAGSTSFYAILLANGSLTNQFATTSDISVTAHILPDA